MVQNNLFRALELSGLFAADPDLDLGSGPTDTHILEKHYSLLLRVTRVVGAAVLARGLQSQVTLIPARRFLTEYRTLIVQVLKKSAGISLHNVNVPGGAGAGSKLEENVDELADAFMVLITATGFLEVSASSFRNHHPS